MGFFKRKAWRKSKPWDYWVPFDREDFPAHLFDDYEARVLWFFNQLRNIWSWFQFAHDCQDPKIGCSCAGSYRFPRMS